MKKYYLHNGTAQEGPFDIEELKTKSLTPATPVWFEPLPAWTTIGEVSELRPLLLVAPPPFAAAAPPPPPRQTTDAGSYEPYQPYNTPKSGITLRSVLYTVVVIAAILVTVYFFIGYQHKQSISNSIYTYVHVSSNEASVGLFGGLSNIDITITNDTEYLLDNVKVEVVYIKQDGGIWKTEYLNFTPVDAYKQVTLKAPDSGRGVKYSYRIVAIKSEALGLE